jgi:hypothetical protein
MQTITLPRILIDYVIARTGHPGKLTMSGQSSCRKNVIRLLSAMFALSLSTQSCSATSITLGDAARFVALGGTTANVNVQDAATFINGDMGIGPSGTLDSSSKGNLIGDLYVPNPPPYTKPSSLTISGSIFTNQNLSGALSDASNASMQFAALTPTLDLGTGNLPASITGNGGDNVIHIDRIPNSGTAKGTFTLIGGPNDYFIFNVDRYMAVNAFNMVLSTATGTVLPNHIIWNVLGTGAGNPAGSSYAVSFEGTSTMFGTVLALNGGIDTGHGELTGALIGGVSSGSTTGMYLHSKETINFAGFQPQTQAVIPEPSSIVMMALGALGALGLAGRRRLRHRSPRHAAA